jgi:hypothetical protein
MSTKSGHSDKTTRSRDAEDEESPPGATAKIALRAIDASIGWLSGLRRRFVPDGDEGRGHEPAAAEGVAGEEAPPRRGFFLRGLLIGFLCLLAGSVGGGFWAHRKFAKDLVDHAGVVERMQEEIDTARKEETRSINLGERFRRENAEMRLQLREAQHASETEKAHAEELDKALADAKKAAQPPPPAKPARPVAAPSRSAVAAPPSKPHVAPKTGNCAVGGAGLGDQLSDCIEQFNRQ